MRACNQVRIWVVVQKEAAFRNYYYSGVDTPLSHTSCISPDPGTTSPAGSPAFMGQDGALSGHEVPGGEVVHILGNFTEHLLIRPATSQRCSIDSGLKGKMYVFAVIWFHISLLPPHRGFLCEGGSPALRHL